MLARLARAAQAAGDRKRAADAWQRVYYEFPLSDAAEERRRGARASLQDVVRHTDDKRDLGARADPVRRQALPRGAQRARQELQAQASGDDREVVDLRIAECDYFLKRYAAARDGVQPVSRQRVAPRRGEVLLPERARADSAITTRRTAHAAALVDEFPDSSWSGEALNNLGTHYIVTNEDDLAAQTFKELFEKFPTGPHAERSAWKYGWWAYTTGNYAETVRVFESAAADFPRSDYRPPFLYWAGRAREKLGAARHRRRRACGSSTPTT